MISPIEFLQIAKDIGGKNIVELEVYRIYGKIKKENPNATIEEVRLLIEERTPPSGWISIKTVADSVGVESWMLSQWYKQRKVDIVNTICGAYVMTTAKEQLEAYLKTAIPIKPLFREYCEENGIAHESSSYANFIRSTKDVEKTNCHPLLPYCEFWLGAREELDQHFKSWSIGFTADYPVENGEYINLSNAARMLSIESKKLAQWCIKHLESIVVIKGQALFTKKQLETIKKQWEECCPLQRVIESELKDIPKTRRKEITQSLNHRIVNNYRKYLLPEDHLPQQGKTPMVRNIVAVKDIIHTTINDFPYISYLSLQTICGLNPSQLRKIIREGLIIAEEVSPDVYCISPNEQHNLEVIRNEYVSLDEVVCNIVENTNSSFRVSKSEHRNNLLHFCEENDYWEVELIEGKDIPLNGGRFSLFVNADDQETLQKKLELWIKGYGLSYAEKITCLLQKYEPMYPMTIAELRKYIKSKPASNALLSMVDLLLAILKKELHEMDEQSLEDDIVKVFCRSTLASAELLSDFLVVSGISTRRFVFDRTGRTVDTSAYSLTNFATIMAAIVNQDVIFDLGLIPKAIENQRFADLWLFVALHMFASWRVTDYIRLPVPQLPYAPEVVIKKIKDETYTQEDAEAVSNNLIAEHQLARRKPNKTSTYSNIAPLYFFCPESCKSVFGTILSIAAAHYLNNPSLNRSFVVPVCDAVSIRNFFGPVFAEACGNRNFSGRRANKALMQAIELEAGGDVNPLVAMNMASQLRSHKIQYGKLAETTSVYLKDAAFSGKTPEFVIQQMFERGVCSFAIDHLLTLCYGERYKTLPVVNKTKVIAELGLTPYHSDVIRKMVMQAQDSAMAVVKELLQEGVTAIGILDTIAQGSGLGKTPEDLCLRKAAGLACCDVSRQSCLGCRYEIRTKALVVRLTSAWSNLTQQMASEENDCIRKRNLYLAQEVLLPCLTEISCHLKGLSCSDELVLYGEIIKEIAK